MESSRTLVKVFLFFFFLTAFACESIRVMSFNILTDENKVHGWEGRKAKVVSMIRFHHADLVGLQESSERQLADLKGNLTEFDFFSAAYNPILFCKDRFEMISSGSFFLSMTPDQPGLGWDAKFPRAVSWVQLKDKKLNRDFFFFNTHFDYHGKIARDESALLLEKKVFQIADQRPFIITGDFNLFPELGGSKTYDLLTRKFADALAVARFPHHGPTGTWSGFKEAGQPGIKPDCIFVSPNVEVYLHGVLSDTFDGEFPSDHLPVVADLLFAKKY